MNYNSYNTLKNTMNWTKYQSDAFIHSISGLIDEHRGRHGLLSMKKLWLQCITRGKSVFAGTPKEVLGREISRQNLPPPATRHFYSHQHLPPTMFHDHPTDTSRPRLSPPSSPVAQGIL